MASGNRKVTFSSWAAAMSVGAGTVEAITERHAGLCRWNHQALPCVFQQRAGTSAAGNGACTKGKVPLAAGGAAARRKARQEQEEELKAREETLADRDVKLAQATKDHAAERDLLGKLKEEVHKAQASHAQKLF